jgi:hypothetical protein
LSSSGKSIKTICSQVTLQQQENKKLVDLTEKLKDNSKKKSELHQGQMTKRDQKWKENLDSENNCLHNMDGTGETKDRGDNHPDHQSIQGNEQLLAIRE